MRWLKMAKSSKLLTRVSRASFAPVNGPKLKKRPRGKPFTPGHSIGAATRFKKGESGNPHGRPKTAKYGEALRALLALKPTDPIPTRTNAEKMAATAFQLAVKERSLAAICEVGDRAEGKAAVSVTVDQGQDAIAILIASMNERSDAIGPAEKRQLTDGGESGPGEATAD